MLLYHGSEAAMRAPLAPRAVGDWWSPPGEYGTFGYGGDGGHAMAYESDGSLVPNGWARRER